MLFHDERFGGESGVPCSEWLESPPPSQRGRLPGARPAANADGANGFLPPLQIGITLQPVALHRNMYASVVEDMILKVGACLRAADQVGFSDP